MLRFFIVKLMVVWAVVDNLECCFYLECRL